MNNTNTYIVNENDVMICNAEKTGTIETTYATEKELPAHIVFSLKDGGGRVCNATQWTVTSSKDPIPVVTDVFEPIKKGEHILTAFTTVTPPDDIDEKTFTSAVWTAIKKVVKTEHMRNYAHDTLDTIVVNSVYEVSYDGVTKKVIVPLVSLMQNNDKKEYDNKALMIQTLKCRTLNATYQSEEQRNKANAIVNKEYKTILQWTFDLFIKNRTDGTKILANLRDVDILNGLMLKFKNDTISTVGEKTIQAYLEATFRQKIKGKEFYVSLYTTTKAKEEPTKEEPTKEEPTKEEPTKENK